MTAIDVDTGEIALAPTMDLETSATFGDLAAAIAKAQAEIENAEKDSKNPHFNSKYASLAAVYAACREAMAKAGVAVIQTPFNLVNGDIGVATILAHGSGQWIKGRLYVKPMKYDAQGVGSVITYLRRYALSAMVGVAPADDDGEAAVGRPDKYVERVERPASKPTASAAPPAAANGAGKATNGAAAPSGDAERFKGAGEAYNALRKEIGEALDTAECAELMASDRAMLVKAYSEHAKSNHFARLENSARERVAQIEAAASVPVP